MARLSTPHARPSEVPAESKSAVSKPKRVVPDAASTPQTAAKRKRDDPQHRHSKSKQQKTTDAQEKASSTSQIHPDRLKHIEASERATGNGVNGSAGPREPSKHSSVFAKFDKSMKRATTVPVQSTEESPDDQPQVLHDLVPLPQPEQEATPEYKAPFSTLPKWLREPIAVSPTDSVPFSELGINPKTIIHLNARGFSDAFAVQTALIPRLMYQADHTWTPPNDICVSAPTGSGKTLAYTLPITEHLRRTQGFRELKAVIVVPTRELVNQALATFKQCTVGSDLEIATLLGNQDFSEEQASLVRKSQQYDPSGYTDLMARIHKRQRFEDDREDDEGGQGTAAWFDQYCLDALQIDDHYLPLYESKVDIIICTPGRLVEHLENTVGFNLVKVEWLVIDEADRLLDQSFQNWVKVINKALEVQPVFPHNPESPSLLQSKRRHVRKVILSATMTRDISQLNSLKLRRPTFITVRTDHAGATGDEEAGGQIEKGEYELPAGLAEFAVPLGEGNDKPLYLLQLLKQVLSPLRSSKSSSGGADVSKLDSSESDSSESDSSDSDSSDLDDSDSDSSDSSSDSDSGSEASSNDSVKATGRPQAPDASDQKNRVLVFASSTAEAHRLQHLLTVLLPEVVTPAPSVISLTKTNKAVAPALAAASVIISTDRASRGLDLPLTHVINYTIPRSLESYVHRVGRTARAGNSGEAWSLFRDVEARWFWNEIARSSKVGRAGKVARTKVVIEGWTGARKEAYEKVLKDMSELVDRGG